MDKLCANFTTTDKFHTVISTSAIMDTMQTYFDYGRCIACCGINNVNFRGTLADWQNLFAKLVQLTDFDVGDNTLIKYVQHMTVIIDKFIHCLQGDIDVNWWNTILQTEERRIGSGGQTDTLMTGWLLHFIGIYTTKTFEDITPFKFSVPIELDNKCTGIIKDLIMESKFGSVCQIDERTYAPRLQIEIFVKKEIKRRYGY